MKHSAKAAARQGKEPGGRRLVAQLPYLIVLAGVGTGIATMQGGGQSVRGGTLVIAGALLAGSVARMVLPEGRAGLLESRRRWVDVTVLAALGAGLLIAGLVVHA